jgi:hypothetical protein
VRKRKPTPSQDTVTRTRLQNMLQDPKRVDLEFLASVIESSGDWVARNNATVILGFVEMPGVYELLVEALNDYDLAIQETAESSLVVHGTDTVEYLTVVAHDVEQPSWVRTAALSIIETVGTPSRQALGVWLRNENSQVLHWRPCAKEDVDNDTLVFRNKQTGDDVLLEPGSHQPDPNDSRR